RTPDPARPPAHRFPLGRAAAPLLGRALRRLRGGAERLRHHPGQAPSDPRRLHLRRRLPRRATPAGVARAAHGDLRLQRRDRRRRAGRGQVGGPQRALRPVHRRVRGQPLLAPVVAGIDHRQAGHRGHRPARGAAADRQLAPGRLRGASAGPVQPRLRAAAGGARLHRTGAAATAARAFAFLRRSMTMALPAQDQTVRCREAAQAAEVVAAQLRRNHDAVAALAAELRAAPPPFVATCARGSSDHAATYAKYLVETRLGVVTASLSPSVGSVYAAPLQLRGALFLAISQSGRSPDLLRNAEAARAAGARVVALVNVEDSPLAALADA